MKVYQKKNAENFFCIQTTKKVHTFEADTSEEVKKWIHFLPKSTSESKLSDYGNPSCPGIHNLTAFVTTDDDWLCSICNKNIRSHRQMYGCRTCDWDCCETCFDASLQNAIFTINCKADVEKPWGFGINYEVHWTLWHLIFIEADTQAEELNLKIGDRIIAVDDTIIDQGNVSIIKKKFFRGAPCKLTFSRKMDLNVDLQKKLEIENLQSKKKKNDCCHQRIRK